MTCSTCGRTHPGYVTGDAESGVVVSSTCEACAMERKSEAANAALAAADAASSTSSTRTLRKHAAAGPRAKGVPR